MSMDSSKQAALGEMFLRFRAACQSKKYREYRLGLIASVLHGYFLLNSKSRLSMMFSAIKKILKTPVVHYPDTASETAIYYSIERNDYIELIDSVREDLIAGGRAVERPCLLALQEQTSNLRDFWVAVKSALKMQRLSVGGFLDGFYYFACYCYLIKGFLWLERNHRALPKTAIFFNSSNFPESMLCEYFRGRGGRTYSLQHGMYLDYKVLPFDVINYSNTMADVLLCWGRASKVDIECFYKKNNFEMGFECEVAGYPRHLRCTNTPDVSDAVLVLLPRKLYLKQCIQLLALLQEVKGERFIIKLHPSLAENQEITAGCMRLKAPIQGGTLSECLAGKQYKAVIGFNSSSILEALPSAVRALVYISGADEFELKGLDGFSTADELSVLLKSKGSVGLEEVFNYYFEQPRYQSCLSECERTK